MYIGHLENIHSNSISYASIFPYARRYLLCSKLYGHNLPMPSVCMYVCACVCVCLCVCNFGIDSEVAHHFTIKLFKAVHGVDLQVHTMYCSKEHYNEIHVCVLTCRSV